MSDALVLCYHAIGESWPSSVTEDRLRRHVEILLGRDYEPRTFADAIDAGDGRKVFAVTFDDAYASVSTRAFPVLRELGVPGTVFVVTSFADEGLPVEWPGLFESGVTSDRTARASLTWSDLRALADAGWEIGSHTCTHPHLTQLDDGALEWELRESRAVCAREMGTPCRSIAYPYGDVDERVVTAAAAAGYEAGCSLSVTSSGPLSWPRVGVYAIDNSARFRLKVSPAVLRIRRQLLAARRVGSA